MFISSLLVFKDFSLSLEGLGDTQVFVFGTLLLFYFALYTLKLLLWPFRVIQITYTQFFNPQKHSVHVPV